MTAGRQRDRRRAVRGHGARLRALDAPRAHRLAVDEDGDGAGRYAERARLDVYAAVGPVRRRRHGPVKARGEDPRVDAQPRRAFVLHDLVARSAARPAGAQVGRHRRIAEVEQDAAVSEGALIERPHEVDDHAGLGVRRRLLRVRGRRRRRARRRDVARPAARASGGERAAGEQAEDEGAAGQAGAMRVHGGEANRRRLVLPDTTSTVWIASCPACSTRTSWWPGAAGVPAVGPLPMSVPSTRTRAPAGAETSR